jgi:hypothetical protein
LYVSEISSGLFETDIVWNGKNIHTTMWNVQNLVYVHYIPSSTFRVVAEKLIVLGVIMSVFV